MVAASAAQRGPLWWVAHHRHHHRHADQPGDPHSPVLDGLLRSHLLWMFADAAQAFDEAAVVPDLARYPELRVLDRYHHAAPIALAVATLAAGVLVVHVAPGTGVTGPQLLVWGFCISTVALVALHLRRQLPGPPFRPAPFRDQGRQPEPVVAGAAHHG